MGHDDPTGDHGREIIDDVLSDATGGSEEPEVLKLVHSMQYTVANLQRLPFPTTGNLPQSKTQAENVVGPQSPTKRSEDEYFHKLRKSEKAAAYLRPDVITLIGPMNQIYSLSFEKCKTWKASESCRFHALQNGLTSCRA